jgi:hypothetical protein
VSGQHIYTVVAIHHVKMDRNDLCSLKDVLYRIDVSTPYVDGESQLRAYAKALSAGRFNHKLLSTRLNPTPPEKTIPTCSES